MARGGRERQGTMGGMVFVREITADDWALMRDVRLADAPNAFSSTYAREAAFGEAQWRGRISARSVTFFAYTDPVESPAGLGGVYVEDGLADLVSMWVQPGFRGRGAGQALVEAGALWAREHEFRSLWLWVTETNDAARRLYERCGFTVTGERQPLPSNPALAELRMRRAL